MTPFDSDLGPRLRAHAALLRDVRDESLAVLRPDAIEALTMQSVDLDRIADTHEARLGATVEEHQAEAVRLAVLRREDAAHSVLRLMQRPAPVLPPGRAAKVLPFLPRTKASAPLLLAHDVPADPPGGAA